MILRAQAEPEGAWFSLIRRLSPGLLGVWYFSLSPLLGIAFPSSRTLGGGCAHPGNIATVGILIPGELLGAPPPPSDSLSDTFLGLFHYRSFLFLTWPLLISG